MLNILVSGASGVIGYGILRSLRKSDPNLELIGTSIYPDSVAPAFCDIFELAPMTQNEDYLIWLMNTIKKHKIDMIIPGIEIDMLEWSKNRKILEETGVKILLNNSELVRLCGDKWEFFKKLGENNPLAIPTTINKDFDKIISEYGQNFLLKPRAGFASKGIVRSPSSSTFEQYKDKIGPILVVQPILGHDDEEYTASAFFDKNSQLCCYMTLRRKLAKDGYTEKAYVDNASGIKESILDLAKIFKPIGPTNFQFRKVGQQLKLLEINPRISSSTAIRSAFGYNESEMSIKYFLNDIKPEQPAINSGYAIRYIEEYIFYDSGHI